MMRTIAVLTLAAATLTIVPLAAGPATPAAARNDLDTNFIPPEPVPPTFVAPSIRIGGGGGRRTPPTWYPGVPMPTPHPGVTGKPGPIGPDVVDLVCILWDYVKDKCVAWKKRGNASNVELWNAAGGGPILNYIWIQPGTVLEYIRVGYFGGPELNNMDINSTYCMAWEYGPNLMGFTGCVAWGKWHIPLAWPQPWPPLNRIWFNPMDADYTAEGWFNCILCEAANP